MTTNSQPDPEYCARIALDRAHDSLPIRSISPGSAKRKLTQVDVGAGLACALGQGWPAASGGGLHRLTKDGFDES